MTACWIRPDPLSDSDFAQLRRRAMFECFKWDPQIEDSCALATFPILIGQSVWRQVCSMAVALARETLAAERELRVRPELHRRLGLPARTRRFLARAARGGAPVGIARLARFDFHLTTQGWRISEANTDVPGGLNEAGEITRLVARHYASATPVGDPSGACVEALLEGTTAGASLALVHATAYTDDHQVMRSIAHRLTARGARALLVSPAHLRFRDGRAHVETEWHKGPIDRIVRFFPSEWLEGLPAFCGPQRHFGGSVTPLCNPATAILTQSKRFPLVWDRLDTPVPTWRALLPDTRDPAECSWDLCEDWVLKPALGRVGDGVGIRGVTSSIEWSRLAAQARRHPDHWIVQRRFEAIPLEVAGRLVYPCLGIYLVDDRPVGAYGRVATGPIIDWRAQDAAVLEVPDTPVAQLEARA